MWKGKFWIFTSWIRYLGFEIRPLRLPSFVFLFNVQKMSCKHRDWIHNFCLSKLVNEEGGFDAVCRERRWTKISVKMGFAPGKAVGSHLRAHYERILYPYNLFQTGNNLPVCYIALYVLFSPVDLLFTVWWIFIGRIQFFQVPCSSHTVRYLNS